MEEHRAMKKKEQFLVRTIGDSPVMMPYGETTLRFNGLIMPNETAAFIWEHLEQTDSPEELAALLCDEFEVSPERALQDCRTLVSQMRQAGWIE